MYVSSIPGPRIIPVFLHYAGRADIVTLRFAALMSAMMLYALAGSPTPDNPGLVEITLAVLLTIAVGLPSFYRAFFLHRDVPLWQGAGRLLLVYGFSMTVVVGALGGNDIRLMLRDMAPFLFVFLPLFLCDIFEERPAYFKIFIGVFAFMGVAFAVRGLQEASVFNRALTADTKELYYFANAPSVLFAALLPAGWAAREFLKTLSLRAMAVAVVAGACTFFPLLAMAHTLQRASIGWVFLSFALFSMLWFQRYPQRMIFLGMAAMLILLPLFWEDIWRVIDLLSHKTVIYGINKREMEMASVWNAIAGSPVSGLGWGGMFEDPAVGGHRVNYTHSLLTGTLLKSGIAGLLLTLAYMSGFVPRLWQVLRSDIILGCALLGPFLIDVLFYASYKWLDFGLLLLLITVAEQRAELHQSAGYCMQKG